MTQSKRKSTRGKVNKSRSKLRSKSKSKAKSRSLRSKNRLPKPNKGALGDYTTKSPAKKRRASLQKQIRDKDYATVIKELNIRAILGKNNAPDAAEKMRQDMQYLKNNN